MPSPIEHHFTKLVDHLDPLHLAALYLGLINLEESVLADPHPRKHNVSGRASLLAGYHRLLARELEYGLVVRHPDKAARVAEELLRHQEPALRHLGLDMQRRLNEVEGASHE